MILRLGGTVRRRDSSSFTSLETAPRPATSSVVRPWPGKVQHSGWTGHLHLLDRSDKELVPAVVLHLEGQPAGEPGVVQEDRRATGALHAVEADTQGPHVHGLAVGHRLVVDLRSSVLKWRVSCTRGESKGCYKPRQIHSESGAWRRGSRSCSARSQR